MEPFDEISKFEEKFLADILQSCKDAAIRTRSIFTILSITSIIILFSQLNTQFTWMRHIIDRVDIIKSELKNDTAEIRHIENLKRVVEEISIKDFNIINIPIIGLKFSVSDITELGALALIIIGSWLYFAMRRESHIVTEILSRAKKYPSPHIRRYLYFGIINNFIFNTATTNDTTSNKIRIIPRRLIKTLRSTPAWIPIVILILDIYSLTQPGIFTNNKPLYTYLCKQLPELCIRYFFTILMIIYGCMLSIDIAKFSDNIETNVKKLAGLAGENDSESN